MNDTGKAILDENTINFSGNDHYLLFRAIRFPTFLNPYSLVSESFAQTELRKLSRAKGSPTRIYPASTKDGLEHRSFTLMVPGQKIFGGSGYIVEKNDISGLYCFTPDMNMVVSGYGKNRSYKNFLNLDKEKLKSHIDFFATLKNPMFSTKVNELIVDLSSYKDIRSIYFSKEPITLLNRDGIEPYDLSYRKLNALYLQKEFEKLFKITLPIFEYSKVDKNIIAYKFSIDEKIHLLEDALKNNDNNINLLCLLNTFHKEIKENKKLLNIASSKLIWQLHRFRFGLYDFEYNNFNFSQKEGFFNKNIFKLSSILALSKTLQLYNKDESSTYVANEGTKQVLKYFSSMKNPVYNIRKECTHPDIHIRNFLDYIDEFGKLMPRDKFNQHIQNINKTFEEVCKFSTSKNSSTKLYTDSYRNKFSFLSASTKSNKESSSFRKGGFLCGLDRI